MNINFQLGSPVPYFNTTATKGNFYIQYPSGYAYWIIQNPDDRTLKDGTYVFPESVLNDWLGDDQVLIDHLLLAAPWEVQL